MQKYKVLITLLLLWPAQSSTVCPVNAKQCSFQIINKTDIPLALEIRTTTSLDTQINPETIPAGSSSSATATVVTIHDLRNTDLGTARSFKVSSVPNGRTAQDTEKSISDTVVFDLKERRQVLPSYRLPEGETETEDGVKYGSFFHEAKANFGNLNDYDTLEITRAKWTGGKFFDVVGIKTVDGREVRVSAY